MLLAIYFWMHEEKEREREIESKDTMNNNINL